MTERQEAKNPRSQGREEDWNAATRRHREVVMTGSPTIWPLLSDLSVSAFIPSLLLPWRLGVLAFTSLPSNICVQRRARFVTLTRFCRAPQDAATPRAHGT